MLVFNVMERVTRENDHPGVGRLDYFLGRVLLVAAVVFAAVSFGPESRVFGILNLAAMAVSVVLDVMRLRNIGVSQWLFFLRFVPYVGLLLSIGLQSAQGGWAETKRFDRAGKSIIGVHAALIALIVYLAYRSPGVVAIPFHIY